jgi:hypothetical protein
MFVEQAYLSSEQGFRRNSEPSQAMKGKYSGCWWQAARTKEIAAPLGITVRTVEAYIGNLDAKGWSF